jgi:hypothetical protein
VAQGAALQLWDVGSGVGSMQMAANYLQGCDAVLLLHDLARPHVRGPAPPARARSAAPAPPSSCPRRRAAGHRRAVGAPSGDAGLSGCRAAQTCPAPAPSPAPQTLQLAAEWVGALKQLYAGQPLPYLALVGARPAPGACGPRLRCPCSGDGGGRSGDGGGRSGDGGIGGGRTAPVGGLGEADGSGASGPSNGGDHGVGFSGRSALAAAAPASSSDAGGCGAHTVSGRPASGAASSGGGAGSRTEACAWDRGAPVAERPSTGSSRVAGPAAESAAPSSRPASAGQAGDPGTGEAEHKAFVTDHDLYR